MSKTLLSYRIDRHDTITSITGDPGNFPAIHGGTLLGFDPQATPGLHWRQALLGDAMRLYLRILLTTARSSGKAIFTPYSGDTTGQHHQLELRVTPLTQEELRLDHVHIHSSPSDNNTPLVASLDARRVTLRRCCVCSRMNDGQGWASANKILTLYKERQAFLRPTKVSNGASFSSHPQEEQASASDTAPSAIPAVFGVCWDCCDRLGRQVSTLYQPAISATTAPSPRPSGEETIHALPVFTPFFNPQVI